MAKFRLGDFARITPRKLKKYTPPGEKEFVDYSLNKIEKSRDPFKYIEENVLAEQEGSALSKIDDEKLGLRGAKVGGPLLAAEKITKVYGREKGYLPQTEFDIPGEVVTKQINQFEEGILTKKLTAANKAYENIKKSNPTRYIKTEEKLEYPRGLKQQMAYPIGKYSLQEKPLSGYVLKTTADDKGELVPSKYHERVWKQRSRIAIEGPKEIPTKGGFTTTIKGTPSPGGVYLNSLVKYVPRYSGKGKAGTGQILKEKLIKVQIRASEFAKGQALGLQKSLSEKGLIGKGESKPVDIKYLKSTSRFKKFMPTAVKEEMGLSQYIGYEPTMIGWSKADHIKFQEWKARQKTGPRPKIVIPKHQKVYKDRKQQLEKEFISKFKLAPGFARQVEIREGQRARPGDKIIYKRGIGIKRKVARQAIKPIRLKEDYQFTAYKKTKPKTSKGFAKRTKKLTP